MSKCKICGQENTYDFTDYTLDGNHLAQIIVIGTLVHEVHQLRHAIEGFGKIA